MNSFKEEILSGLRKKQKTLPSKYFYDKKGDALFQQIMQMESYYLPGCEREIIEKQCADIATILKEHNPHWNIVELGAGDGTKTAVLLKKLNENEVSITYTALDISPNILQENKTNVTDAFPKLEVHTVSGNYFETCYEVLKKQTNNLILFLGSTIGNYNKERANEFFQWLHKGMNKNDLILIAFDLKKHPKTILNAYNDKEGITKAFNLNLLTRINRELIANFDVNAFDHYPYYDPLSGNCLSFLISLKEQNVTIGNENFSFYKNEVIHTEISKKYHLDDIGQLSRENSFEPVKHFIDSKRYYSLSLLRRNG